MFAKQGSRAIDSCIDSINLDWRRGLLTTPENKAKFKASTRMIVCVCVRACVRACVCVCVRVTPSTNASYTCVFS